MTAAPLIDTRRPTRPQVPGWLAPAALALVAVLWGVTFTVADGAATTLPGADLVVWRFGLATVLLTLATRAAPALPPPLRGRGIVLGALLGAGFLLQAWALTFTDALTSGFLTSLLVVVAPLAAWLLFRERLGRATWAGVGLATAGVVVLSLRMTGLGPGELLTLASAAAWGVHVVLLSRWSLPGHALRLARVQTATVAGLALLVVTLRSSLTGGPPVPAMPPDMASWTSVLFLAVLATAAAMVLLSWAQSRLSGTRAAVILTLEPAMAGVTAVLTGAAVTGRIVLGAALLLGAMYVVELGGRR